MRPSTPANRITAYYRDSEEPLFTVSRRVHSVESRPRRRRIALVHRLGGPAAGIVACLLQLSASTLCIAGAVSSWLGHPVGLSPTTAVLLIGAVFGASSVLLLYSFVVAAAVASADSSGEA